MGQIWRALSRCRPSSRNSAPSMGTTACSKAQRWLIPAASPLPSASNKAPLRRESGGEGGARSLVRAIGRVRWGGDGRSHVSVGDSLWNGAAPPHPAPACASAPPIRFPARPPPVAADGGRKSFSCAGRPEDVLDGGGGRGRPPPAAGAA